MTYRVRASRLCALAVLSICAAVRADDHTFQLDTSTWQQQPTNVHLAGDFNGWNVDATPMKVDTHRVWSVTLDLEPGQHAFKFVADAGTAKQRWLADPKGDKSLETGDGNQGMNSGVVVGIDVAKLPPAKPNDINLDAFRFNPKDATDWDVIDDKTARIRVRVLANDVEQVTVQGEPSWSPQHLQKLATERGLDVYGGIVHYGSKTRIAVLDGSAAAYLGADGRSLKLVNPNAPIESGTIPSVAKPSLAQVPAWTRDAIWYQIFVERFRNGDTANDPGAFSAYERLIPWNADWFKAAPGETPGNENFFHGDGNVWKRRYGGDLAGVREKLPYLRSLGINAIYFNPIFEAESMHKYDTADYRHVDDNFGLKDEEPLPRGTGYQPVKNGLVAHATLGNHLLFNRDGTPVADGYKETEDPATWRWTKSDLLFLDFLADAHAQGFHVIVDGVFNHVGRAHVFFQDVLAHGKNSKYADWFDITDFGDPKNWHPMDKPFDVHGKPGGIQWTAWDGKNGYLPNWKKDAKLGIAHGGREHILAIAKRWEDPDGDPKTHDGIDGWRLDAAEQVPHPFWEAFRTAVRAANPDAYIDGEIWNPAQPWVNDGKEFDAVMNYQFAMATQDFFVNVKKQIKPSDFNARLVKLWFMYPAGNALAMQNLFDSHDTDRVASMFVNPDRPYDGQNRVQDNAKDHPYNERKPTDEEWSRLLQMVAFQHAFVGAPMTYYGDEYGMWGSDDPSDRQPMPWEDKGPYAGPGVGFNKPVFDGFQRFIAIRNAMPALQRGSFYPATVDDAANVYAFGRELDQQHVYVALNRSNEPRTVVLNGVADGTYIDYADSKSVKIEMPKAESATARPKPTIADNATRLSVTNGTLSIILAPHGVAILANGEAR